MEPVTQPTTWTVQALLAWTTDYLRQKGAELREARLESQILLAHVMDCPRIELVARSHEVPTTHQRTRFKGLIQQRIEGWPVAYLVGQREFYLLSFDVTPAVLIPRPDTETIVLTALDWLKAQKSAKVLDIGTGSGCIAISIAQSVKSAHVLAVDISPDALEVARCNAARHGVTERVTFLQSDLFSAVPIGTKFDLIVSNPPYITSAEMLDLAPEVRNHEPRIALEGGPDGLAFYRRIAANAGQFLSSGGCLLMEVGWTQDAAVREIFTERSEFRVEPSIKDRAGQLRVVRVTRL